MIILWTKGQGTWKFDDRLLLSVSGVDRIQTIIAEVLRDIVEDDEREISVNIEIFLSILDFFNGKK